MKVNLTPHGYHVVCCVCQQVQRWVPLPPEAPPCGTSHGLCAPCAKERYGVILPLPLREEPLEMAAGQ